MFKVKIHVVPKKSIADPQGSAVKDALGTIGFSGIEELRIGKIVEIKLESIALSLWRNQYEIWSCCFSRFKL